MDNIVAAIFALMLMAAAIVCALTLTAAIVPVVLVLWALMELSARVSARVKKRKAEHSKPRV